MPFPDSIPYSCQRRNAPTTVLSLRVFQKRSIVGREKDREREMEANSGSGGRRVDGSAKARVVEQISQAVQSTSNLLRLMQESSPSQVQLAKLPKNLLAKVSTIKNTGQVLEQLPRVISSLDAYIESSLHSATQLMPVTQLLSNMQNSQLKHAFPASRQGEEPKEIESAKIDEA